jgi:hypothetical protein
MLPATALPNIPIEYPPIQFPGKERFLAEVRTRMEIIEVIASFLQVQ